MGLSSKLTADYVEMINQALDTIAIPVILQNASFERRETPQACPLLPLNGITITQA